MRIYSKMSIVGLSKNERGTEVHLNYKNFEKLPQTINDPKLCATYVKTLGTDSKLCKWL